MIHPYLLFDDFRLLLQRLQNYLFYTIHNISHKTENYLSKFAPNEKKICVKTVAKMFSLCYNMLVTSDGPMVFRCMNV